MSNSFASSPPEPTALDIAYRRALRTHALILVALGYARMVSARFVESEEDAITGELTKEMKGVLEDHAAPDWMQNYSVHEQVRSNAPDKEGKRRPIVDIEFERHKRGRRPRFRFEAKRLGRNHSAGAYFGDGGLEAFVSGYYDRTHEDAGMLGYVQSLDETKWSKKLSAQSTQRALFLGVTDQWSAFVQEGCPTHTFRTRHRDQAGRDLEIFHVLLRFR
jgi:hypothetical protein